MASKRRNMFYENKKQETTEIVFSAAADRRNWPQMEKMIPATNNNNSGDLNKAGQDEVLKELENLQSDYEKRVKYLEQLEEQYGEAMEERVVKLKKARQQLKDLHLEVVVPLYARHEATKIYGNRLKVLEDKINCTTAKQQLIERIENLEKLVKDAGSSSSSRPPGIIGAPPVPDNEESTWYHLEGAQVMLRAENELFPD
ncbi:hypothetical protein AAG570_000272 [Ranatra chinensis]|uniref:Uncharacterized protein n=1 Tax=Ranatra chinensis TaxID=642074 RepID=A0ABD0YWK3_9HEMI